MIEPTCYVKDCGGKVYENGLCTTHYQRKRYRDKHGDTTPLHLARVYPSNRGLSRRAKVFFAPAFTLALIGLGIVVFMLEAAK